MASDPAPVFIVGVGRSGSSVFHRLLCRHPGVAWLSSLLEDHPDRPARNHLLMQMLDVPVLGSILSRRIDPGECYRYWDELFRGFSVPCRDLRADDVPADAYTAIPAALRHAVTTRRAQLLVKITGWPRIGFLRAVFPEARFIHIMRDGRPVAASFLRMDWWWGWRGPANWRWGELDDAYDEEWRATGRSFVALAGIQWKILMDAMEEVKRASPGVPLYELKYEDLCQDPVGQFRRAVEFAGLPWVPAIERAVRAEGLRSGNEKWRRELTTDQQSVLEHVLHGHLVRYGYA